MLTPTTARATVAKVSQGDRPPVADLVQALLYLEKHQRSQRSHPPFSALKGSWQLVFITGTKKARQSLKQVLKSGRYLPKFLNITITYDPQADNRGQVMNQVRGLGFRVAVGGPILWYPQRQILAFDFLSLSLGWGSFAFYDGGIRGGQGQESAFFHQSLKTQPFFTYFLVGDRYLAARGKGGGLALWIKNP